MIDLETFGVNKSAVIVQIGACYFNEVTGEIGDAIKINVDPVSGVKAGCRMDAQTVCWWMNQSDEARKSILADPKSNIHDAMNQLNNFLSGAKHIWSHATFDFVIVQEVLTLLGIPPKFQYKAARDIRTLSHLSGNKKFDGVRTGTHHDALDDCLHQVKYCVEAMNRLKGKL